MATMSRERQSLFPSPPRHPPGVTTAAMEEGESSFSSPYSLSKEDMNQLTEEFDHVDEELTTSGRTYEELVSASQQQQSQRNSSMNEDTVEENEEPSSLNNKKYGRQSMGLMPGRNSLSNWSTVGEGGGLSYNDRDDGIPSSVHMEQMNTGRKSNVSRLSLGRMSSETPNIASHVNVSQRRSVHVNNSRGSRGQQRSNGNARFSSRPSHRMTSAGGRRSNSLNMSHISSSSSSGMDVTGESMLGESWSPIRTSLENSFAKSVANEIQDHGDLRLSIGGREIGSISPIRARDSKSLSPEITSDKGAINGMNLSPNKACDKKKSSIIGTKMSGSLSPHRVRTSSDLSPKKFSPVKGKFKSPTKRQPGRSMSPMKNPKQPKSLVRSPTRSPLGEISPNRSPAREKSPKRGDATSPKKMLYGTTTSVTSPKNKALSPNGTYSLEEAEGTSFQPPIATKTSTVEAPGSISSSNMSVSSGSEATASSALLLAQSVSKSKKGLSTLSTSDERLERTETKRNASTIQHHVPAAVTAAREEHVELIIQSPEKQQSTKGHVRSPAPTPNSRRRVIKRFRASIPTANYLAPEGLVEESVERNPNRKVELLEESVEKNPSKEEKMVTGNAAEKNQFGECVEDNIETSIDSSQLSTPMEVEEPSEPMPSESSYENAFEFPSDSIPVPRTKTLRLFHDKAISNGSNSHQYQLNRAGTNLLSLQEVILPSIACETNAVLKKKQAKAQRNVKDGMPDSQGKDVVEAIETCRKVVAKCTGEAMKVAGEAWRERERERERLRLEKLKKDEEQRRLDRINAKKERRESRARSRQQRYERQKREKQRNHPRNKELWQEVAKLMVDIQKLEKEERLWKEALVEVNRLEEHHQPPEKMKLDSIDENETDQLVKNVENASLESTSATLVQDVTMATERISWMLKSVSLAMEESDKIRTEAYEKYQYDGHKFYGYPQVDDSKGLFMALSMESPLRE